MKMVLRCSVCVCVCVCVCVFCFGFLFVCVFFFTFSGFKLKPCPTRVTLFTDYSRCFSRFATAMWTQLPTAKPLMMGVVANTADGKSLDDL